MLISFCSCNESDFLKEVPSGKYTAENMYKTKEHFDSQLYNCMEIIVHCIIVEMTMNMIFLGDRFNPCRSAECSSIF